MRWQQAAVVAVLAATAACSHSGGSTQALSSTVQPSVVPSPLPSLAVESLPPIDQPTDPSIPVVSPPPAVVVDSPAAVAPASADLTGKVIVIDPGHNGGNASHPDQINALVPDGNGTKACDTAGASTDAGYPEYDFTMDVALRAKALLEAQGATVTLTRPDSSGVGPCVNQRAAIGNDAKADAAISIHADGGPATGRGFHIIEPGGAGPSAAIVDPSLRLGLALRTAFTAATAEPTSTYTATKGLIQRVDLGGLNLSTVPKVFIECANMRNATDAALVTSEQWRQQAAQGIADGLGAFVLGQ